LKTAKIKKNGYRFAAVDILAICCESVITIFLFLQFLISVCRYAVNWCDKLRFLHLYNVGPITDPWMMPAFRDETTP